MLRFWSVACATTALLACCLVTPACGKKSERYEWKQDSAESVLLSLTEMVELGQIRYMTELIWAPDDLRRTFLRGIGSMLQSLHDLSQTAAAAFAPEVRQVLNAGEAARAQGQGVNPFARLAGQAARGGGSSRFTQSNDFLNDITKSLITDPYGFIERNADKLGVEEYDLGYILTYEERPTILGFLEIFQQMDDGKWYILVPDRIINVDTDQFWPRDENELEIALSVMKVLKNALDDVRVDIEEGRVYSLEMAAENLGKYLALPLPMAFAAYNGMMQARARADRDAAGNGG